MSFAERAFPAVLALAFVACSTAPSPSPVPAASGSGTAPVVHGTVPALVGLDAATAAERARAAGLRVRLVGDRGFAVIRQSPPEGWKAPPGAEAIADFGTGVERVPVADGARAAGLARDAVGGHAPDITILRLRQPTEDKGTCRARCLLVEANVGTSGMPVEVDLDMAGAARVGGRGPLYAPERVRSDEDVIAIATADARVRAVLAGRRHGSAVAEGGDGPGCEVGAWNVCVTVMLFPVEGNQLIVGVEWLTGVVASVEASR